MKSKIDGEIKNTEKQIRALNEAVKEFVGGNSVDDLDVRYSRLFGFAQDGQRLQVELLKLKSLKEKYCI